MSLLVAALVAAAGLSLWAMAVGFWSPITDLHPFRQTQTALSAYWIAQGGPLVGYETPALGAPWAIPFEFPLYQWLAAALHAGSGVALDQSGRLVSYVFFALTFAPLRRVVGAFDSRPETFLIAAILLLCAPNYLFWSRTFMIESLALFAAMAFLACALTWLRERSGAALVGALIFGVVAGLQKVTTLAPALAIVALAIVVAPPRSPRAAARLAPLIVAIAAAVLVAALWVAWTDRVKALNPIGAALTSSGLREWNFGSLALRLHPDFWRVIGSRMIPEAVGSGVILLMAALYATHLRRDWLKGAIVIGGGAVSGVLVFANLHYVHNYYQYSVSIYLVIVAALALGEIARRSPVVAAAALATMIAAQIGVFRSGASGYLDALASPARLAQQPAAKVAAYLADRVAPDAVLLGFGFDWSAELPYLARRKALMAPGWALGDRLAAIRAQAGAIGGQPVGAVVLCHATTPADQRRELDADPAFVARLSAMTKATVADCDVYTR